MFQTPELAAMDDFPATYCRVAATRRGVDAFHVGGRWVTGRPVL